VKGEGALLEPGGRILAVDDQRENLELLEEVLGTAGYDVSLAESGEAALLEVARQPPDCVVLDIMMPRLDGYEVCARLKADPRTRFIPVVMLTALSDVTDKVKGLEAGADDFLNKPFRRQELLARTRSLVKIRRLREELDTAENVIFTMVRALESKDPQRAGHSERVAASAMAVASYLGLSPSEFEAAGRGGMLHDIGKLGVPEDVLWAEGPLSPDAEAVYRRHPELGERILAPLRSLAASLDVVRHHHERLDGSGYPDGLTGDEITAPVEIVAVANLYDDLVHLASVPATEACVRLRAEATAGRFHAEIVEAFLRAGTAAVDGQGRTLSDPWHSLAPMAAAFRSGTVLVADDSTASRSALKGMLEDAGFPVIAVESAEAVLPAVTERKPDLVIIDSRLRGLDGFALCGRIKAQPETEFLPVVLVTAADERRDRARSAEAGADDFLGVPVNRLELVARVRSLLRLRMYHRDLEEHQNVLLSLASVLEAKDPYTRGHSARVGQLAAALAREIGLPAEDCDQMQVAGLLHDIGKVGVPQRLINKPGTLTEDEFLTIMSHPSNGESMCRRLRTVRGVLPMILHHHERWNGRGYPEHLRGEEIPIGARVLSLADAYDALTSDRSYRKSSPPHEALAILGEETAEGQWDPHIYRALAAMIGRNLASSP